MFRNFQDPMGSFLLVVLQGEFQGGFRSNDRYYSPASTLKHCRVSRGNCLFDIERFPEKMLLACESPYNCVLDSMPADIVRIYLFQLVLLGVSESRTVGSLHPLVHSPDQ